MPDDLPLWGSTLFHGFSLTFQMMTLPHFYTGEDHGACLLHPATQRPAPLEFFGQSGFNLARFLF